MIPLAAREVLQGRTVLVTGGGFIGGRLAELLAGECGADVRVLVRREQSVARFAGLGCSVSVGDVTDRHGVEQAVAGCDAVFHCAFGTSGHPRHRDRVTVLGTRRVMDASAAAGVRRVVHLSTYMVYGRTVTGEITETSPRPGFGTAYADSKLRAEREVLARAAGGGVPAVVLQPANVYGPRGGVWVEQVLARMASGRLVMVDGGEGAANVVYVDDVVAAALLAAVGPPDVVGETFLVSAAEPVTWLDYFSRFERLAGLRERLVSRTADEARADWQRECVAEPNLTTEIGRLLRGGSGPRRLLRAREVRAARHAVGGLLPPALHERLTGRQAGAGPALAGDPDQVHLLSPEEIDFFASRAVVRIDKARRMLGYRPRFGLAAGVAATAGSVQRAAG